MRTPNATTLRSTLKRLGLFCAATLLSGITAAACAPQDEAIDDVVDGEEPTDDLDAAVSVSTVAQAASNTCTTASIKGLSAQIIAEGRCIEPDAFTELPELSNLSVGSAVFPYLEKPARDRLVTALKSRSSTPFVVNSALRTVAQQYLLYNWYQNGRCGISLAAKPGNSNHETGLALDVDNYSTWRSTLEANGFRWFGSSDRWHFDYVGSGAKSYKGLDIKAFQRLWNRNNPNDKISEDGVWGPNTEARMRKAPADGFPIGPQCGTTTPPACTAVFADICGSPYQEAIEWLAAEGLTSGCDATKKLYCPDATLSRGQMASFLAAALDLPAGPDAFTDDDGSPYEAAINALAAAGITSGCDATQKLYCPDETVTRGQMAVFLTKAFNLPAGPDAFTDDDGSAYESAINSIAAAGITTGCDTAKKLYCPNDSVTRGQMASFLYNAMN